MSVATADASTEAAPDEVAGRSLWEIPSSRIRRDRTAVICFWIVVAYYAVAILSRPFTGEGKLIDPVTFDGKAISDNAGAPVGALGGISREHLLGVEWPGQVDAGGDGLGCLGLSVLAAERNELILGILPGDRSHIGALGRAQLHVIGPQIGVDD